MISPYNVGRKKNPFTWWKMLLFSLLFLCLVLLLFPKTLFINALLENNNPSQISISYLKNLIAVEPTNLKLKMKLAEEEFQTGKIAEAKKFITPYITLQPRTEFQWQVLLLNYRIIRIEAFELREGDPRRKQKLNTLRSLLVILRKSPYLSASEQGNLGDEALTLDAPELANFYYQLALKNKIERPAQFFAKAGTAALYAHDYLSSAEFYLIAMQKSASREEKRIYFIHGVNGLLASGDVKASLDYAQKNIDGLKNDRKILIYLAKIALQGGQQSMAESYVNQLMQLHFLEPTQ